MVINTHSPRVIEHRKTIIKLMLASHPDSCLVCDKGNQCQLRRIAADMGIGLIDFERIPLAASIEEVNPFIERDLSKCILCAKCIRACQELVVEGAVDYFGRGFTAKTATLYDLPLEGSPCTFCGTCVALCPTGALMEKDRKYAGTARTTTETTCPFCGCGCSICLEVKGNQILRVKPGEETDLNHKIPCVRGSYGYDFVHSQDRLTRPLVKVNGEFEEITWEQALEHIAVEFKQIIDRHHPDSLAILGSSRCTNEENYLLQRFARCVLGTNNIDNGSRIYNTCGHSGNGYSAPASHDINHLGVLEQSDVIVVIGANPTSSAPSVGYAIKRAVKYKGARLILIDPRQTGLSSLAHLWLRPRIGSDVALLNSMAKVVIDEGLLDKEFVSQKTDNIEELTEALERYTPDYAEEITGIPGEDIRSIARLYAAASQAVIVYGTGVTQHTGGIDGIKALTNLSILTGNIKCVGGGLLALQRDNNGQGACDMGALPDFLPGYERVTDTRARNKFKKLWKVDLPASSGLTAVETVERAKEGQIKGMWIVGENPVLNFPHGSLVAEALSSLDFLVVQDMFLTETAKLATVVLPATSFSEKEGTFTNFEGRIGIVRKAIEPVGESLPDWEIILRLADKMNHPLLFSSLQQVMDEIKGVVPLYQDYSDPKRQYQVEPDSLETGHTREHQSLNGLAHFSLVEYTPPVGGKKDGYPLNLLTGTLLYHQGSGTRSSRALRLKKHSPQAFVEMGQPDAKKFKINHGDMVRIVSPTGELTAMAKVTDTLPGGTLFMPISFPEAPANELFDIILAPEVKTPSLKTCKVRIERA